jgi:hypothetical protein
VQDGAVEVVRFFSGKETVDKLNRGNLRGVGLYSNSSTNNKPNYGLVVKARKGGDIRFSNEHKENELRWLASEMLASLADQGGLPTEKEKEEMYFSNSEDGEGGDPAGTQSGSANFEKHGVKITLLGGDEFVIEKNGSKIGKMMLIGGLFGVVFSSIFIGIGFFADDGDLIFGIVGIIFATISFLIFILGLSKLGTSVKFTFNADSVAKEKFRGGVSKSKTSYQKSSFQKLKVKSSGSSNGATRYSVELKSGHKPLKLFSWVDQDVSEVVKHKVNAWLKPDTARSASDSSSSSASESPAMAGYGSAMTVEQTSSTPATSKTISPDEVSIYSSTPNLKEIKGGKWFLRIFLSIFLIVGIGMIVFGVSNIRTAKDSETWPSKEGVILKSKISVNTSDDGTTYGADVSYEFRVGDMKYKGDKVTISEVSTSNRSRAKKIVKRYRKGSEVPVFYDPNDPERNVLEPGLSGGSWLLPGIGLAFLIIPLIILITIEKANRKESKKGKRKSSRYASDSIQKKYGKMD